MAAAFDGEAERAHLLAHVPGCDSCSDQLEVIAVQREALGFLGDTETAPAGTPAQAAVRRLLEQSAVSGRAKLADLVYELSKACLFAADDLNARLRRDSEPRAFGIVRRECDATMSRLESGPRGNLPDSVPASTDVTRARRAARSCQLILEQLEGDTPRCVLLDSLVLINERKHAEAEKSLRALLERPLSRVERRYALMNLIWALSRLRKYRDARDLGEQAIKEYPDEWVFSYNLVVACCCLGDLSTLKQAARAVKSKAGAPADSRLARMLRAEAPSFAAKLSISVEEALDLFGFGSELRSSGVT